MKKTITTLFVTALLLSTPLAFGQIATGSLSGTITDSNGAGVPGAKLIATSTITGAKLETVSTETGFYVFAAVPVSSYTLSVEKSGFKKVNRQNIEVRIAQRLDLDIRLEIGDVQQTIDVTAEAPLLETSTSDKGTAFSPKFMSDVPLFTGAIRNPRSFISYIPGVNAGAETSISGSGGRAVEVQIDGASLIIPESGGTVFNMPSAEMFNEFKLITGGYSAEYGRFGGGVETYATKSGTNWFHGSAFLNMRRDIWNANAWARNAAGLPKVKERQNEIGGSGGGPVYIPKVYDGRQKTFFFYTYTQRLLPISITGTPVLTVPTAAMKTGDFSALGTQLIYDPNSTNGTTRTPFPGNQIPQNRFSNVSKNLLPLLPNPTRPGLQSNYDFVSTQAVEQKIWSIKVDHNFTATNRLAFFLSREDGFTNDTSNFAGPIGNGIINGQKPWNIRVNHDFSFRPTFFMHTTFGYSAVRQTWDNPNQFGFGTKLGIPGIPKEGDALPRINFSGQAGLAPYGVQDGKVANGGQDNDTIMITQGYTWLKGKHEIKFGWDHRLLTTYGFDYAGSNGQYFFNRAQTAIPNSTGGSGHEFASLLLGAVDSANNTVLPILLNQIRYRYTSGFINDNFRITKKLTLNLGLRYEVPIGWHVEQGNYSGINLTKANIGAGNLPGALEFYGDGPGRANKLRPYPTDFSNIGPRLGFAYQIAPKTVLRGGWGIFYQTLGNGGCGCRQGFANSNQVQSNGIDPILNWDGGIPLRPGYQPPPLLDPTLSNFQSADYFGPNYGKAPRIWNWSFNIQHEVKGWLIDVGYVGNRGKGLNSTISLNQLPTSYLSLGSLLTQTVTSPAAVAAGIKLPYAGYPNRSVAQSLRPFPQYLDVLSRNSGFGQTWYDAFQAKLERRFGAFNLLAGYTWSKSLSNAHWRQIFSQQGNIGTQDAYNVADGKSFNPFDQPHVLNIVWTYDAPFGRGKKFLSSANTIVNAAVSGWTLSGAQRYYSGNLIQLVTPGNPLGTTLFSTVTKATLGSGPIRTSAGYGDLDPNNPNVRWFNASAFQATAPFTLGNAAFYYSDFRQPMIAFENIGISKRTVLFNNDKNPVTLQYRADMFNLFNRTRFGGVNGTVGNVNFGRPTGPQVGARAITMGLRLSF